MQHASPCHNMPQPDRAVTHAPDLGALRPSLLRYARARLRNVTLAEDAVSETLLAAWQAQSAFATRAQATAWVYGILRHKLVDQLRRQGRETPAGDGLPELDTRSPDWFVGGDWCGVTSTQTEPEHACSQRQFIALLLRCCEQLPPVQRQAFLLRELSGEEPESNCRELGVTEGHLWVLVHRARVRLRRLLCDQWLLPHEALQAGQPRRPRRPASVSRLCGGKAETERPAPASALRQGEVATDLLPEPLDDHEAQPAASRPLRPRLRRSPAELARTNIWYGAGAEIERLEPEPGDFASDAHTDSGVWECMVDGDVEQVGQHFCDPAVISPQPRQPRVEFVRTAP